MCPGKRRSFATVAWRRVGQSLAELGWTGDDLNGFILKEMDSLLLDKPRLAADRLAALLAQRS